jgi:hypothetical protein
MTVKRDGVTFVDDVGPGGATPVEGTKSNDNAPPGSNNLGTLPAVATAVAPTHTEGNQVALSTDLSGSLRTAGGGGGGAVTIADGADVNAGSTTDAAVTTDIDATLSSKLRGLVKIFGDVWDDTNDWLRVLAAKLSRAQTATFTAVDQEVIIEVNGSQAALARIVTTLFDGSIQYQISFDEGVTYIPSDSFEMVPGSSLRVASSGTWSGTSETREVVIGLPFTGITHAKLKVTLFSSGSAAIRLRVTDSPIDFLPYAISGQLGPSYQGGLVMIGGQKDANTRFPFFITNAGSISEFDPLAGVALGKTAPNTVIGIRDGAGNLLESDIAPPASNARGLFTRDIMYGVVDSGNSSTTPLVANDTFTGAFTDILQYRSIQILIRSDQDSASGGVKFQWSSDGISVDLEEDLSYVGGAIGRGYNQSPRGRFFRIVYTNGGTNQTVFRLQSILQPQDVGIYTRAIDRVIDENFTAVLTRGVIVGKTTGMGGGYVDVKVTPSGALAIAATIDDPIGQQLMADSVSVVIASNQSAVPVSGPLTDAELRATAVPISAASLPLPTGASTEATLNAVKTATEIIDDWDESDRAKVNPIVGQAGIDAGLGLVGSKTTRVCLALDFPANTVTIGDSIKAPLKREVVSLSATGDVVAAVPTRKIKAYAWALQSRDNGMTVQLRDGAAGPFWV